MKTVLIVLNCQMFARKTNSDENSIDRFGLPNVYKETTIGIWWSRQFHWDFKGTKYAFWFETG